VRRLFLLAALILFVSAIAAWMEKSLPLALFLLLLTALYAVVAVGLRRPA
jgi:hypothetical protein